jgi:hypothetical protein
MAAAMAAPDVTVATHVDVPATVAAMLTADSMEPVSVDVPAMVAATAAMP